MRQNPDRNKLTEGHTAMVYEPDDPRFQEWIKASQAKTDAVLAEAADVLGAPRRRRGRARAAES